MLPFFPKHSQRSQTAAAASQIRATVNFDGTGEASGQSGHTLLTQYQTTVLIGGGGGGEGRGWVRARVGSSLLTIGTSAAVKLWSMKLKVPVWHWLNK